jgi:addiction module HigA family antidote
MARLLIHPGEHLADELQALGMSANQLAKELGVPTNRITEIIRGKRGISGDTALRLGRWFGTGPDIWMNLQKNYELRLAAREIGEALEKIPQHGGKLYETALAVEKDEQLRAEMADWDVTVGDGIEPEI